MKEAREKAMQWCSRREYCSKNIFDKVVSWGYTPEDAREIVDFLIDQKFVDDRRFTDAFVKDKLRFNKWGRVKITYMLRSQNIDKNIIMDALSDIDEDEYNNILMGELQKKYKSVKGNTFEIKGKLFRFAASRGFESEIVNEMISRIVDSK